MWYALGFLALLLLACWWPTARRRCQTHLQGAHQALARRDWADFDRQMERARVAAESLGNARQRAGATAHCDLLAARADYWRGRLGAAAALLPGVIDRYTQGGVPDQAAQIADAERLRGDIHFDLGELEQAAAAFQTAAQRCEIAGHDALAIFLLQRHSDVLLDQGRPAGALPVIEHCLALEKKVLHAALQRQGKDPGQVTTISMSMPDLALARGDYEQAEQLFREKADYWEHIVTRPDNIDVMRYQFHLAAAQQGAGKHQEAMLTLRRACATAEREFGAEHPRTARARQKLAAAASSSAAS